MKLTIRYLSKLANTTRPNEWQLFLNTALLRYLRKYSARLYTCINLRFTHFWY